MKSTMAEMQLTTVYHSDIKQHKPNPTKAHKTDTMVYIIGTMVKITLTMLQIIGTMVKITLTMVYLIGTMVKITVTMVYLIGTMVKSEIPW